jgi:hypothetical protein
VFQQWRQHALKAHVEHNPMFTALQVILYSCTASAVMIVNYERSVPPQWPFKAHRNGLLPIVSIFITDMLWLYDGPNAKLSCLAKMRTVHHLGASASRRYCSTMPDKPSKAIC